VAARRAAELGLSTDRIAVIGDSAGGGLAAAVSILARDRQGPAIAKQILLMPMLDDRNIDPDPHLAPFVSWTWDDNRTGWGALLGDAASGPDMPAAAAPARVADPSGLPPAYVDVGQLDIFRDESIAYALRLSQAGVPVEFHLHPGLPHLSLASPSLQTSPGGSWPTGSGPWPRCDGEEDGVANSPVASGPTNSLPLAAGDAVEPDAGLVSGGTTELRRSGCLAVACLVVPHLLAVSAHAH
jgi:acetyl esterase/lipase